MTDKPICDAFQIEQSITTTLGGRDTTPRTWDKLSHGGGNDTLDGGAGDDVLHARCRSAIFV
jgi:hypothetical protein